MNYCETHVGHKEEVRSHKLTNEEKEVICNKLRAGVSDRRIVKDARTARSDKFSKMNLLNKNDIRYLKRKYVEKRRHVDDAVAVAMKVEEWNSNGKNYVFLYKPVGEHIKVF